MNFRLRLYEEETHAKEALSQLEANRRAAFEADLAQREASWSVAWSKREAEAEAEIVGRLEAVKQAEEALATKVEALQAAQVGDLEEVVQEESVRTMTSQYNNILVFLF